MQAIIIAGGKGSRMGSITTSTPKLLLPINNSPLIDHSIRYLKKNGCSNVIICCGHLSDKIKKHVKKNDYGIPINLSVETKPLGTAGPLHLIKNILEDEFLVLFGDIYTTINLKKIFLFHRQKNADATLVLHTSDHPQDSMVVKINKENKLLKFIEKPGKNWGKYGNLTKSSLYILKKNIIEYIAEDEKVDFDAIFPKMLKYERKMFGYITKGYIKDIGTPKRYQELLYYVGKNKKY